jgi:hypothetical protein
MKGLAINLLLIAALIAVLIIGARVVHLTPGSPFTSLHL